MGVFISATPATRLQSSIGVTTCNTLNGNLNFEQTCKYNATCLQKSSAEEQVTLSQFWGCSLNNFVVEVQLGLGEEIFLRRTEKHLLGKGDQRDHSAHQESQMLLRIIYR